MKSSSEHILPDASFSKFLQILASSESSKIKARKVQDSLCGSNGVPKVETSLTAELVFTRPVINTPLDIVSNSQKQFRDSVRYYLKNGLLHDWSNHHQSEVERQDFSAYKTNVIEQGKHPKYANTRFSVFVPTTTSSTRSDLKQEIQEVRLNPISPDFSREFEANPEHYFMVIGRVGEKGLLIAPKVFSGFNTAYGFESYSTESQIKQDTIIFSQGLTNHGTVGTETDLSNLYNNAFYSVSNESVQVNGKAEFPYLRTTLSDLAYLYQNYTFILPKEFAAKLIGEEYEPTHWANDTDIQYLGFSTTTGNFSTDEALENRDYLWKHIIAFGTTVVEGVEADGSSKFQVKLDLTSFCRYAKPIFELVAE